MKRILLSLFCALSAQALHTKLLTAADARASLQQATAQDAQLLLNLIYWSYQRSAITCASQTILFDAVQQSWQLWLNGATTRRNPRTPLPYPDVTEIDCYYANLFAQAQSYVNSAYCNALSCTIEKDSVIESQAVTSYIEQVRSEARIAIAKTVISALADLETTLASIQTMLTCVQSKKFIHTMQTLAKEVQDQKDKSFIDDGIQFVLNNLALQAFAQSDKNYLATSDQFFKVLADTQTLYITLWDQLETARANYYQGIYETVYNCMIDLEFPSSSFLLAIDADGRIDVDKQTEPLPATLL
jgi:hypothetical protein